ncbi:MAG: hypothetical protein BroJett013_15120 [Alphaproteobacteria bacterium]|nr:MAG: hypothetical protein BroJett013_15120 [Alphaproteobacteria bacterium]
MGTIRHLLRRSFASDRDDEFVCLPDESRLRRRWRQRREALADRSGKLLHLGIFRRVHHGAVRDGPGIVDREIVQ